MREHGTHLPKAQSDRVGLSSIQRTSRPGIPINYRRNLAAVEREIALGKSFARGGELSKRDTLKEDAWTA